MLKKILPFLLITSLGWAEAVVVNLDIQLERAYVRSNSNYGMGAVAMVALAGPFSRNIIRMYVKKKTDTGNPTISDQQLKWGQNKQTFSVDANSDIVLSLFVGGTRAGEAQVGTIRLTDEKIQNYSVKLVESGAEIIGQQRPVDDKAKITPAPTDDKGQAKIQPTPNSQPQTKSVVERLQTLKSLRDQGLLSDDEYEAKRRELVKDL